MKRYITALLAIALIIAAVSGSDDDNQEEEEEEVYEPSCKRMTAAIRFNGNAYIFFGNQYVSLDQTYTQSSSLLDVYPDWNAPWPDAAVLPFWGYTPFFFSSEYIFWPQMGAAPSDAKDFGGDFFKDGLDAAGYINNTMVFIKGCHFKSLAYPLASGPVFTLDADLPCSPDAALTEGENLLVFKDDLMWVVEPTGVQEGMPIPTNLMITLNDVELCTEDDK